MKGLNENSLDRICASLAYAMGIEPPKQAAEKNADLAAFIDRAFGGERADRVVMYNPDAIAQWIYEKYADYTIECTGVPYVKYQSKTARLVKNCIKRLSDKH